MKIDDFMPVYDERTSHRVRIRATPEQVWDALDRTDFSQAFLVRVLMSLRSGRIVRSKGRRSLRERLAGTGFVELAATPQREVVIGVAGRFWRPDGGRCFDLVPEGFAGFDRSGYAKAAMSFCIATDHAGCVLSTETRVKCYGAAALRSFRAYWTVVKPFSGLIRRAILHQVKRAAESERAAAAAR